eukprot:TRINITY_DN13023_c0_g2_i1.p1 TRINITY_DN13023_c0_g2~~TRINITY_DN13023_c0_g2_i1.p1  ORF type:complete len:298 (-),score=57.41 TRINITY_DN13023_c0_g2_i1:29-922(-)
MEAFKRLQQNGHHKSAKTAIPIQAKLRGTLKDQEGKNGVDVNDVLAFDKDSVSNLYTYDAQNGEFKFNLVDVGVPYGEKEVAKKTASAVIKTDPKAKPSYRLEFVQQPTVRWGINFVGMVKVLHDDGYIRTIYLPGERTYDPAGISGDPHASERIGGDCFAAQTSITVAQLKALEKTTDKQQALDDIQEASSSIIQALHGRTALFGWMKRQVQEAVIEKKKVTPYPAYILEMVAAGKLSLEGDSRAHSRKFFESYKNGHPTPPAEYYRKCHAKEAALGQELSADDKTMFDLLQNSSC